MHVNLFLRLCLIGILSGLLPTYTIAQTEKLTTESLSLFSDTSLVIGGSSLTLLRKNVIEINTLTSLNSYQIGIFRNRESSQYADIWRITDFDNRLDTYWGLSDSGRLDIGFRLEYRRRRIDNDGISSPFKVLEKGDIATGTETFSQELELDNSLGGISRFGIRARVKPLKNNKNLTLIGGYSFGTLRSPQLQENLQVRGDRIDLTAAYYAKLNLQSYYFFSLNGIWDLENKVNQIPNYQLGANFAFIHTILSRKFTIYPGLNYSINAQKVSASDVVDGVGWTSQQFSGFLGAQLQFGRRFLINGLYVIPIRTELGTRAYEFVPNSQSTFNVGLRFLL